ncbi:signal recognition particle protein [Levilinea saccharolytica]|uniref:Signal recognition particle protein n=1 Tax=Levilinea saccharolytica TaxID=229921 RepID=A0A0P6YNF3_9CHLR|nr:signal recognition particle protein [Levilinea saccharolytica]KPL91819.1 signal recognition particle [Levilinea saccharolytica]GAP17639.1 signal recognition particle subunit FFH/SRP54 [Levilinea saccharolytica]
MFENLSGRLNEVFQNLRRRGKLTEADVDAALREVRMALLEADVNYGVVKDFIARVRERAVGAEVSRALNPAQQVIKIVHEELLNTLGPADRLNLSGPRPRVMMMVGLQGSGKTTAAAKIARLLRSQGERVLLVAADPYRPAAIKQLQTLGERVGVPVFTEDGKLPPEVVQHAFTQAEKGGVTVMIVDTAGRSQLDQQLMDELRAIARKVTIAETLLVVDSMIGQEAVHIATGFRDSVSLSGLVLTKMDGDARGGASISIRSVTGVPIKFLGTGEGIEALEAYDPARLAGRILGMGDVLGLIEKAEAMDQKSAQEQAERMMSGHFTLEDFANQLRQLRKMGPLHQILEMLPGNMGQMARQVDPRDAERQLKVTEAILSSMTQQERNNPDVLNASRRRRIARGSGTDVQDVNRLLKQFREMQRVFKTLQKTGGRGMSRLFG